MKKSVTSTRSGFATLQTGRANSSVLDRVVVNYYGVPTKIAQLAQVSAAETRLLVITPYEKTAVKSIAKAITEADIGLNPVADNDVVRIHIPSLTDERRAQLIRQAKKIAEQGRVAVRNNQRDAINSYKREQSPHQDQLRGVQKKLQLITREYVDEINQSLEHKENELRQI